MLYLKMVGQPTAARKMARRLPEAGIPVRRLPEAGIPVRRLPKAVMRPTQLGNQNDEGGSFQKFQRIKNVSNNLTMHNDSASDSKHQSGVRIRPLAARGRRRSGNSF
jgi:hypothetical protein